MARSQKWQIEMSCYRMEKLFLIFKNSLMSLNIVHITLPNYEMGGILVSINTINPIA